jgi:RNA polymerase sigma-70 factor (ECF subfamily)
MFNENEFNRARNGDLESIEEICASTWEPLYRYIYYKVQNREEAEDITQETFVKAISYMQKGSTSIEKYVSFLKTVSLNVIRDKWRKKKRRGTDINLDDVNPEVISLEDSTEISAQRELIKDALGRLSEEQRKVIELRILKGYTVIETARNMNKTEGAVRALQYRALQALSIILRNND